MTGHKLIPRLMLLVVAFFVMSVARATVWSADNIPMVHLQDRNRYVCDPDNIISPADLDSADVCLKRLDKECGIQTVFIVVGNVKNADCFRMAEDVGNKYGVGDKKTRRGLVIVISVNDRRYFIAPGKGLEGDLTDVECDDIARECIVKNMKVNDVDRALLCTAKALYTKFKTGEMVVGDEDEEAGEESAFVVILVLLICFAHPIYLLVLYVLEKLGLRKPRPKKRRRRNNDDWFPPFFLGGGGGSFGGGGGSFGGGGGSFGGGSFGGGGSGGGW